MNSMIPTPASRIVVMVALAALYLGACRGPSKTPPHRPTVAADAPAKKEARPMNVLFVVCDDLNTRVGPSGYSHVRTPALDSLAAEGMTLRRAYCQYPVCGPSRASFLSGLYPESSGVINNKADIRKTRPGTISLPGFFKKNGYWTGGVGKIFHTPRTDPGEVAWDDYGRFKNTRNPVLYPIQQKFEAKHGPIDARKNKEAWRRILRKTRSKWAGQVPPGYGPTDMTDAEHMDGKNARQIVQWLDDKAFGEKPFFITCGIQKPHVPFWAPQKYFDAYPQAGLTLARVPADDWNDIPEVALDERYLEFGFKAAQEDEPLARTFVQAYHACITFIDAQIGLLFDALKRNGLWENTIVVFTSDHGYQLGEHFMWGKVTLFEECARVPMIVRVPGRTKPSTVTEGLVELLDIYPTLADLCGIRPPRDLQGRSFADLIDDPSGKGKDQVYTVVTRDELLGRSIRTARWRYAEWGSKTESELYDLNNDPDEYKNLVKHPKYRKVAKDMARRLNRARVTAAAARR